MSATRGGRRPQAAKAQSQAQLAQRFMGLLASFQATLDGERASIKLLICSSSAQAAALLEPGASSRLLLSLRSGQPEDQDFALERLIQASDFDPELLPLQHHTFLLDALLDLIDGELDRRREALASHPWATSFRADWASGSTRRANEAALIIRNLATLDVNAQLMQQQAGRRMIRVITESLELGLVHRDGRYDAPGPSDGDHLDELKLYMLEILSVLAPYIRLQPAAAAEDEAVIASTSAAKFTTRGSARRLLPVLVALSYSSDRALVVLAMTAIAEFAKVDAHEPIFSSSENTAAEHSPLARALELLPLQDAEINAAVLEYLYAVTTSVTVAIELTKRIEFLAVLRQLFISITRNGEEELFESEIITKLQLPRPVPQNGIWTTPKLPESVLDRIVPLPEPDRAMKWMQYVYEEAAGGEVSQKDLWAAYQAQFYPYASTYKMIEGQQLVRYTGEAFESVVPSVRALPDGTKHFYIRNMRVTTVHRDTLTSRAIHTQLTADRDMPAGRGFLAAFALRNIARAIRSGFAGAHDHSDRSDVGSSALFAVAAGASAMQEEEEAAAPVKMSPSAARGAAQAFISLEPDVLRLFTECQEVSPALSEVMDLIDLAQEARARDADRMHVG